MSKEQGVISFEAGGATRRLSFNINTLCALEDEFDCAVEEIGAKLSPLELDAAGKPVPLLDGQGNQVKDPKSGAPLFRQRPARMSDIRRMFRAALAEGEGEGVTLEAAGEIMAQIGPARVSQLVQDAFVAAFPDAVQAGEGNKSGNRKQK